MPFVRISLPASLSQETKHNISRSVQEALMQEFHIPENDFFQVIEELAPGQMKFPPHYLGVSHSAEIVFIQIIAGQGRTEEQKRGLYREIAERVSHSTPITKNNLIIVLLENGGKQDWSFGNGEIQEPTHLSK